MTSWGNTDWRIELDYYRFLIAFNVTSHLAMMAIPFILDIKADRKLGNLMGGLIVSVRLSRSDGVMECLLDVHHG